VTDAFRPGDQCAVAGNFIVFDCLRRADDGGIEHILVGHLAGDLISLADKSIDGRALHPFGLLAELLEHLTEPRDLVLGLFQMVLKPFRQVSVGGLFDELGQRFNDLIFGIIDVFEAMEQKIIHRLDILGEQSHG
jgi:hypothetical protein